MSQILYPTFVTQNLSNPTRHLASQGHQMNPLITPKPQVERKSFYSDVEDYLKRIRPTSFWDSSMIAITDYDKATKLPRVELVSELNSYADQRKGG